MIYSPEKHYCQRHKDESEIKIIANLIGNMLRTFSLRIPESLLDHPL